jgi:hypothetical protein
MGKPSPNLNRPSLARSSHCRPAKVGWACVQVAMGFAHSIFLVDPDDEKVKAMPVWECEPVDQEAAPGAAGAQRLLCCACYAACL